MPAGGGLSDNRSWIRSPAQSEEWTISQTRIEKEHSQPTVWVFYFPWRNIFNQKTHFVSTTPHTWCHLHGLLQGIRDSESLQCEHVCYAYRVTCWASLDSRNSLKSAFRTGFVFQHFCTHASLIKLWFSLWRRLSIASSI